MAYAIAVSSTAEFQSTRPRGARHGALESVNEYREVSIHAPARGATRVRLSCAPHHVVSIHAPARGATVSANPSASVVDCFNPRAREGRDRPLLGGPQAAGNVSIHAPARGATNRRAPGPLPPQVSIHAPARGATSFNPRLTKMIEEFQSTRPRGARRMRGALRVRGLVFQSTRPRGARRARPAVAARVRFQSTRPRGARPTVATPFPHVRQVSIHAPARGATRWSGVACCGCRVSIHAPARGATSAASCSLARSMFQSTRPRGARQRICMT